LPSNTFDFQKAHANLGAAMERASAQLMFTRSLFLRHELYQRVKTLANQMQKLYEFVPEEPTYEDVSRLIRCMVKTPPGYMKTRWCDEASQNLRGIYLDDE
jgi:hypothetical protein